MAIINKEIDTYRLYHYNVDSTSGNNVICSIYCFKGGQFMGGLTFYKEGVTIPPSVKTTQGEPYLRFPENQLANIIETLRQEKPLYLWFNDISKYGGLKTSSEPVGEEES